MMCEQTTKDWLGRCSWYELPNEARLRKRRGWETVGAGLGWPPKRGTVDGRRCPVFFFYEFVLIVASGSWGFSVLLSSVLNSRTQFLWL